jgi:predicted benzoate:H+ symporter BenE
MKNLTTANGIDLSLIFLASVMLVIHSLRPDLRRRRQRLLLVVGLLGLPYVAMDLCWHLYMGVVRSWATAAFFFAWHSIAGISLALLLSIYVSKKVVLGVSGLSCVALSLSAIVRCLPRHLGAAIDLSSLGVGLLIGASFSSVSHWFNDGRDASQSGDVVPQSPE